MRLLLMPALLLLATAASTQTTWTAYLDRADRFSVNFPGEPEVHTVSWDSEYGAVFPGRVHRYVDGDKSYSITAVVARDLEIYPAVRVDPVAASFAAAAGRPGDRIAARCHRHRDGSNGCLLGYVTPEGGVEKLFD